MRRPTLAGRSGTVRSAVAARLGASGPTPRACVSPMPALLRPGARPPCWGSRCLSSLIFLSPPGSVVCSFLCPGRRQREPISSSCGDSLVRRARPAPGSAHAQSLVLDLNAGRRAPPAVRGRLRRDVCDSRRRQRAIRRGTSVRVAATTGVQMQGRVGRDVRAAAGRRAVVGHVARPTAAVLRRKCPPKSVWGTIGVSQRPVRSDSRSIAASRFFHRRHRPEPGPPSPGRAPRTGSR